MNNKETFTPNLVIAEGCLDYLLLVLASIVSENFPKPLIIRDERSKVGGGFIGALDTGFKEARELALALKKLVKVIIAIDADADLNVRLTQIEKIALNYGYKRSNTITNDAFTVVTYLGTWNSNNAMISIIIWTNPCRGREIKSGTSEDVISKILEEVFGCPCDIILDHPCPTKCPAGTRRSKAVFSKFIPLLVLYSCIGHGTPILYGKGRNARCGLPLRQGIINNPQVRKAIKSSPTLIKLAKILTQ